MAIICSSCDHEPAAGATAGTVCTSCGERLISIDTRDDIVGSVIDGRFEVLGPLGHGGMGIVYRAKQLSIGREVALKVLDRRIEKDVASVKRFFREAKVASTLAHPNTVPIIDFGQHADGRLYLVMELVRGKTLLDEITKVGPLPLARVIAIGVQLCDALEVAHELSIVHRDLKLENVMLLEGKRDHVKILDFGLARSLTDPSTQMTATGMISGTPRYMPPEVALEAAAPAPSQDIYAVGVMLAELVIGRALWVAPTMEALFAQKLGTEQSIVDVPDELKPLVRSMLDNDPTRRPTAAATRAALRALEAPRSSLELELDEPVKPVESRFSRAASPVALDPTQDLSFPDFSNLSLASLDERDGAPPPAKAPPPGPLAATPTEQVGPPGTLALDERFGAPKDQESVPLKLELDRGWEQTRAQKQVARAGGVVVQQKKSSAAGVIVALLLVALVGVGVFVLYNYRRTPAARLPGGGVSIHITADGKHDVSIDGSHVGTTPLSLQRAKGTRPLLIEGTGLVSQQIVPDRDQTVHLAKP